jgi:ABC-type antimicrobial peptide transport system permease subunit
MLSDILIRLRAVFRRNAVESELDDELRFHFDQQVEKYVNSGLSCEKALRRARLDFGSLDRAKEECRDARGVRLLDKIAQDVRFGARMMARSRGFTIVLVAILALGIGGTTAVYSVVDGVLLRPLPFPHSNELMVVDGLTYPKEIEPSYWAHNPAFDQLAEYSSGGVNLSVDGRADRITAAEVSASFFPVLEVAPALGRGFLPSEEATDQNHVVVLSHDAWARNLSSDPSVLGQTLRLNGIPHTIVGVMPPGFNFPEHSQIWILRLPKSGAGSLELGNNPSDIPAVGRSIGRLKPGVTPNQALNLMTSLSHRLQDLYGDQRHIVANDFIHVWPLQEAIVRNVRAALFTLLVAVVFLLMIVCANAANMLLGRVAVRRKEFAVRLCLGATRMRIARQLITESLLLALTGGALGILFARWFVELIRTIAPADVPRLAAVRIDPQILLFAVAISSLAGILIGLVPAVQVLAPKFTFALKEESYRSTGAIHRFLRGTLVVAEIALSLVLLSGAGLMIQSLYRLTTTELGFNPQNVVTIDLDVPDAKFTAPASNGAAAQQSVQISAKRKTATKQTSQKEDDKDKQQNEPADSDPTALELFHQQILEKVRGIPGVVAAGTTSQLLLKGTAGFWYFDVDGKPTGEARIFYVSDDYFRAMGIPLIAGRPFTESEELNKANVVIISQSLARAVWPGRNPVGQQLKVEKSESVPLEIVGVARDVTDLDAGTPPLWDFWQFYFPEQSSGGRTLVVRTSSDPGKMIGPLRREALSLDRDLTAYNAKTMEAVISTFETPPRFRAVIFGLFAAVALALALLGVYGVMAYSVNCRTHEIGVRISLGASGADILRLILGGGMRLATLGAAIGVGLSLALNRLLQSLLFGISAADPRTLTWSAGVLVTGALVACWIPARRAMRIDPMAALRHE